MHPIIRKRLERAARNRKPPAPPRVWDPARGIRYCAALPVELLEPICERVSRVQGESFERLCASIAAHGLANPLITVSELPGDANFDDWQQYRYRFLWTIGAPIKIVVGHNRYAAIKTLGWTHVPVLHCGPLPEAAQACRWRKLRSVAAAQKLLRDGELGLGPFSLVMAHFTPPLKAVPAGYEP